MHLYADHRIIGRAVTARSPAGPMGRAGLVGHEQDVFPFVLHTRVGLSQVGLSKVNQVVLVLADNRLTAGTIEVRLHEFSVPQTVAAAALAAFIFFLYARTCSSDPLSTTSAMDICEPALP